jgi:hypothetical protein
MNIRWPILFLVLAAATCRAEWQVALSLRDGSRILGVPSRPVMTVEAPGVGTIAVPWERIRRVQCETNQHVTVQFLNHDKLFGRAVGPALAIETLFGARSVPWELIRHAHWRRGGGRDVTWELLPIAPRNFDSRPATPTPPDDGGVVLDGWQVRSRGVFTRPIRFECQAMLTRAPARDAALTLRFVPTDEPRDVAPQRAVLVTLGQRRSGRHYLTVARNGAPPVVLYDEPGQWEVGAAYALRVRWDDERLEVAVNDSVFVTDAVVAWYERFHLDLTAGGTGDRWEITDCVARSP